MIVSPDQYYSLIMQKDGNLVAYYNPIGHAVWATGTNGKPVTECVMQSDGNLVLYEENHHAVWASGTNGKTNTPCLRMQNDGNVVIYKNSINESPSNAVWSSKSNGHC